MNQPRIHTTENGGEWRRMEENGGEWKRMEENGRERRRKKEKEGEWRGMEEKGREIRRKEEKEGEWRKKEENGGESTANASEISRPKWRLIEIQLHAANFQFPGRPLHPNQLFSSGIDVLGAASSSSSTFSSTSSSTRSYTSSSILDHGSRYPYDLQEWNRIEDNKAPHININEHLTHSQWLEGSGVSSGGIGSCVATFHQDGSCDSWRLPIPSVPVFAFHLVLEQQPVKDQRS